MTPDIESHQETDEEEDDLDKFMASIDKELESQKSHSTDENKVKDERIDLEDEDDQESYFNYLKNSVAADPDDEENVEYDDDGYPIPVNRSREIAPLPPVDHSEIIYNSFQSDFYEEHPEISNLSEDKVEQLRKSLDLRISGLNLPRPAISFAHFNFDEHLIKVIRKHEYTNPSPIQAQGIPIILSGRDLIGIAKTGSGKTACYLLPMMIHVIAQPEIAESDGPIALVCAPTRELCQQIYLEARKFAKSYNLTPVAVFGGGNKYEQGNQLKQGPEIVICTPGRLIDLIKSQCTNLRRVTLLVLDEADRMFDLGFEPQIRSIASNIRPDRQCLLFSATFKKKIEKLCREILTDPIRVITGEIGEACEDVLQIVQLFKNESEKWVWLYPRLVEFCAAGSVLIFVTRKVNCEELAGKLKDHPCGGSDVGVIHGDFTQFERDDVMRNFRTGKIKILVATDVAARGLDIPSIRHVINYDVARDINTHTHRIGRTGRAGEKGVAYTLVLPNDEHIIPDLVRNLESANQKVPDDILNLAMNNPWFRKTRMKQGNRVKKHQVSNSFTPRVRPGLGLHAPTPATSEEAATGSYKIPSIFDDIDTESLAQKQNAQMATKSNMSSDLPISSSIFKDRSQIMRSAYAAGYSRFQKATSCESSNVASQKTKTNVNKRNEFEQGSFDEKRNKKLDTRKSRWN